MFRHDIRRRLRPLAVGAAAAATAVGYMVFESQWLLRRQQVLPVPRLPAGLEGLRILHISDVHAGQPGFNLWNLRRAVEWAAPLSPDMVVLTGDILGGRRGMRRCLELLGKLEPRLGTYTVPGNHEYGLSKNPLAHRPADMPWSGAGITSLRDACVTIPVQNGTDVTTIAVCGADYVTGGYALRHAAEAADFSLLLIHRPPHLDDPLTGRFPLAFAGHTHGGQIRIPTPWGRLHVARDDMPYSEGVHRWGDGVLVLTRGVGTTFLPFRLATRPEVVLYRLAPDVDRSSGPRHPPPP